MGAIDNNYSGENYGEFLQCVLLALMILVSRFCRVEIP